MGTKLRRRRWGLIPHPSRLATWLYKDRRYPQLSVAIVGAMEAPNMFYLTMERRKGWVTTWTPFDGDLLDATAKAMDMIEKHDAQ